MRRLSAGLLLSIALVLGVGAGSAQATDNAQVVVKFRGDGARSAASRTGGHVVSQVASDTVVLSVPSGSESEAINEVKARADVVWAEPEVTYHAAVAPNDPCYSATTCTGGVKQYNAQKVNAPSVWDTTTGDPTMTIAVVDSGVDPTHPDLAGRVTVAPNFSTDPSNIADYWHGTHVAGVVGANGNNGIGVAGMDWRSPILSVKVLDSTGTGVSSGIAAGLRYAVDHGARIVNLSIEGVASQVMADAVLYAEEHGVLLVAAAGNSGSTTPTYPAAFPGVFAVGASDGADALASYSNRGSWVDILAPGSAVVSTRPVSLDAASSECPLVPGNAYCNESGTSMAAPLVAGAAALLWALHPYLTASGVIDALMRTAHPVAASGTGVVSGRLDVGAAFSGEPDGYRMVASDGGVFPYGAEFKGSTGGETLNKPIVAGVSRGTADGYWLVASDGGVFNFGSAIYWGSTGAMKLNKPIVAAMATRSGYGYWLVASDGGVFSFGDAQFEGSTGAIKLNKPIVAAVPTQSGAGYWLIASDGGVFSFGDAAFYGSTGGFTLNKPIVAGGRSPEGHGYWLVASDGGVFSFGDALFYGSSGAIALNKPIVSMTPTASGRGYWLIASDGGVFSYGDARFLGSTGNITLNKPIVSVTAN